MDQGSKHTVLKQYFGYDTFREGQEFLIDTILSGRDAAGVMPTGAGKSICFQVPALLMNGITLVVSPLISLMKDQVGALTQAGVPAAFINSSLSSAEYREVLSNIRQGKCKILYIAPERLLAEGFLNFIQEQDIAMVTVDEAHCVSQWGQDFRPSYLEIDRFVKSLDSRPILSAFTATATEQVRRDIVGLLDLKEPEVLVTGFDRKNLYFEVQKPAKKLDALLAILADHRDKSGIIYCATRKSVEDVCEKICAAGYPAVCYHAGLPDAVRKKNQDLFIFDEKPIVVATNAFGMGIDKSNVSFVVHYNMPGDMESYYQEAGRAGRDGEPADCILLYSGQDVRTQQFFIENADRESSDPETDALLKQRDRQRLKDMTFYCHTNDCLRGYMLKYFGEDAPVCCDHCGNCQTQFEILDITIEAQKILSCIKRTGQRFGIKVVVDTLRGSKNQRILSLGFDKLSTYNIMADISEKRIRDMIHYLTLEGFIHITDDEYPVMRFGPRARDVLFGGERIEMKLPKEKEPAPKAAKEKAKPAAGALENPGLFDRLRNLRGKLAAEQNVPAYVVFSNAALTDMCRRLPKNNSEFLEVSGVGKAKLERYGEDFLQEIQDWLKKQA